MRNLILLLLVAGAAACVKPKVYQAEQLRSQKCEARETVLVKELLDRKNEAAKLIEQVGSLNKTIGNNESEIADLRTELAARTQQMGESSTKLLNEKRSLEKDLDNTKTLLESRDALIQRVYAVQDKRRKLLADLKSSLTKAYEGIEGAVVSQEGEEIILTLSDKNLFDPAGGLNITAGGKTLLTPLANYLTQRPDLDIDVVAYTDNVLPKDKTLKDTWDWSLQRATNVVRLLIRDFNVNANQLTPVGRGEFYPVTSNETPEGRQKNRRTSIIFRPVLPNVPLAE